MGYLMAIPKLIEGGVDLYDKVQAGREKSKTQDFLRDNPDWASSPEKMSQLVSISPTMGMQLLDRSKNIRELQSARAGQRLQFEQMMDGAGAEAYERTLAETGAEEGEEGGAGAPGTMLGNYADAETAANDAYQRMRLRAKAQFGEEFADGLPLTWDLNGFAKREESRNRVMDSMREQFNVVHPDGAVSSVSMAPHEASAFVRKNPKLRLEKLGTSAAAKPGEVGGIDPKQRADIIGKVGDDYYKASNNFMVASNAFRTMNSLAENPNGPADLAFIYSFMKLQDPGSTVREGEYATAQNAGGVSQTVMNTYNRLLGGEKISETRGQFLDAARKTYADRVKEQEALDRGLKVTQKALRLDDDAMEAIKGRVPRVPIEERKKTAKAEEPTPAADATVTVGKPGAKTGEVTLGGKQFKLEARPKKKIPSI